MRLYSYIVTHDSGFSPNPFHGVLTLACCKPMIRRTARPGDLVVGLSTRGERVVYAMRVAEKLSFNEVLVRPPIRGQGAGQSISLGRGPPG